MLENIFIARHGFRQGFNWPKTPTGIKRDPPLTAFGETQAKELATYFLNNPDIKLDAIFSSPWYRCLQTATPTALALNLPIFIEFGIAEFFMTVAPGTGLHPRPFAASTLQTYFPHVQASSHRSLLVVSQSGESIQGLHERAKEFLRRFVAYVDANLPNVKSVLLVSHAATVIALGRALVGHPDMDVRAGTASLSHYTRSLETVRQAEHDSYGHWTCKSNGETGHLAGGEQRNWSFEGEVDYEEHGIADILEESELSGLDIDHAALYRYQSIPGLTKKHKL